MVHTKLTVRLRACRLSAGTYETNMGASFVYEPEKFHDEVCHVRQAKEKRGSKYRQVHGPFPVFRSGIDTHAYIEWLGGRWIMQEVTHSWWWSRAERVWLSCAAAAPHLGTTIDRQDPC
jgi:hypothetical protein